MTDPAALDEWVTALTAALGLERSEVDVSLVLDLARDSAHAVARPAAPVTTYLVGFAAAQRGGTAADVAAAAATATRLATAWPT